MAVLEGWELSVMAIGGLMGFYVRQLSLATDKLVTSVATVSVVNPVVVSSSARWSSWSGSTTTHPGMRSWPSAPSRWGCLERSWPRRPPGAEEQAAQPAVA